MKTVVFLLGTAHKNLRRSGEPLSPQDYDLLNRTSEKLDVQAVPLWVVPDPAYAGLPDKVTMAVLREHRAAVLDDIRQHSPDVVMACGPLALKCLLDKGNVTLKENMRQDLEVPELPGVTVIATHSLEQIAFKPGMDKWLTLDLLAGLGGRTKTEWGKYEILLPGTPAWAKLPPSLASATLVGLDLETYPGLSEYAPDARIRMAVISDKVGRAWVVQARRDSKLPAWLRQIIEDPGVTKCGSNIKYDYRWLRRFGYEMVNMHDTSTAEHVLDCTNPLTDLKSLTFIYVPRLGDYSREHRALVKERGGWEYVTDEEQYQYCGGDGEASIGAAKQQLVKLKAERLMRPFGLSMDLYAVLARMESDGACVAPKVTVELDREFRKGLRKLTTKIYTGLGPLNLNSPAQLVKALTAAIPGINLRKDRLGRQFADSYYALPGDKPDDDYSTDRSILEREASKHPIIETLLQYRRFSKLHTTYVESLRDKHMVVHGDDGLTYVHTSYRTDVVETYRLSSQGPNLQNIPRKPEPDDPHPIPEHLNIKRQFISRFPGGSILEADLSQAEIRVAAHLSQDKHMIDAICSGEDLHTALTAKFHGKAPADVTKLERTHGKRQTFLVMYGGGARTLAAQIGVSKAQAKELLAQYFDTFRGLDNFIKKVKLSVKRDLYSESMFGYRRKFRAPHRWDQPEGWAIERAAWNHQVQNGAAAMVFVSMIDTMTALREAKLNSLLAMQVHDSLVFDVYPGEEQAVVEIARHCLEHPNLKRYRVEFSLPLVADVEIGPSWGEKKVFDS